MWRILAAVVAIGFLIALLFTDLSNGQRWLLAGLIWATTFANWERR